MPKQSERRALLKSLKTTILAKVLKNSLTGETTMDDLRQNIPELVAYVLVSQNRYLVPRGSVPRAPSKEEFLFNQLDNDRFKQELRMNRSSFFAIYEMIKGHEIFVSTPQKPQTDVKIQMMVALERLGSYGNGASVGKIARSAGVCGKIL